MVINNNTAIKMAYCNKEYSDIIFRLELFRMEQRVGHIAKKPNHHNDKHIDFHPNSSGDNKGRLQNRVPMQISRVESKYRLNR